MESCLGLLFTISPYYQSFHLKFRQMDLKIPAKKLKLNPLTLKGYNAWSKGR